MPHTHTFACQCVCESNESPLMTVFVCAERSVVRSIIKIVASKTIIACGLLVAHTHNFALLFLNIVISILLATNVSFFPCACISIQSEEHLLDWHVKNSQFYGAFYHLLRHSRSVGCASWWVKEWELKYECCLLCRIQIVVKYLVHIRTHPSPVCALGIQKYDEKIK